MESSGSRGKFAYEIGMICPTHGHSRTIRNPERGLFEHSSQRGRHEAPVHNNSRFPAAFPTMLRRKHPARSMNAVGWATLSRTPTAWHWTIPIWLWLVSLATAKRRHGPLATRAFQQVSEPATDGVVLPTLLNGYKSANPYVLVSRSLTTSSADGYARYFLEGSDPEKDARNIGSHVGRSWTIDTSK